MSITSVVEPTDGEAVRDLLQTRRRRLAADLETRVARLREADTHAAALKEDTEDDSSDLDLRLLELTATTLRRVDQAIESLDKGRYGWCTRCSGKISEMRLRALPFAVRCRECEAAREAQQKREADRARASGRARLGQHDELAEHGGWVRAER